MLARERGHAIIPRMAKLELKDFDEKLHEEIRQQAKSEDRTMKAWVTRALKDVLKRCDKSRRWQET
jgi:hypothetical protein